MSHVVGVDYVVDDLDALEKACRDVGCELRYGQRSYNWYGKWVNDYDADDAAYNKIGIKPEDYGKCEHAISVTGNKEAYEVGLVKNPNGPGWKLIYDFYGEHGRDLCDKIGQHAGALRAHYNKHRLMNAPKLQGKTVAYKGQVGRKLRVEVYQ